MQELQHSFQTAKGYYTGPAAFDHLSPDAGLRDEIPFCHPVPPYVKLPVAEQEQPCKVKNHFCGPENRFLWDRIA